MRDMGTTFDMTCAAVYYANAVMDRSQALCHVIGVQPASTSALASLSNDFAFLRDSCMQRGSPVT